MADDKRQNGPAYFVNAEMKDPKSGGNRYCWSKTFDLREVERELGTSIVTLTLLKPKNAKTDDERLVIFKESQAKFLPRKKDGAPKPAGGGQSTRGGEVEL